METKLEEIAVLGAGNGGQTMAADLALAGFRVNLYEHPKFAAQLDPVIRAGGLTLEGAGRQGFAKLNKVTTDAREAVESADLLMVVSALPGHEPIARAVAPHARDGQVMVFNTGYWSAFRWQSLFQDLGKDVTLAEAAILIYICSIRGPARVRIDGRKRMVHLAAYPGNRTPMVYDLVSQALDGFTPASSILETNLINPNYIFHPPVVLANLAVIEHTRGDFTFYRQGVTPAVARLIEAVDEERLRVAAALGLELDPAPVWLQKAYGARGDTIYEALQTTEALEPSRYTHVLENLEAANFIREDIPFGLGPLADLGRLAGVPTPATLAIIHLLSVVTGEDHLARSLTMEKMGLGGLRADQIIKVFTDGR